MTWRLAKSLTRLREQVNLRWPERSKQSDGSVGDTSHAARPSDHNPDANGVVKAIDITHDPANGFNSYKFADWLMIARDSRIKYVISNSRIASGSDGPQPWVWRKYTGANKHDHHVHISVKADPVVYDNGRDWFIDGYVGKPDATYVAPRPTLRKGSKGDDVKTLQGLVGESVDGDFGPMTEAAVISAQKKYGIVADGIVGPQTWKALETK